MRPQCVHRMPLHCLFCADYPKCRRGRALAVSLGCKLGPGFARQQLLDYGIVNACPAMVRATADPVRACLLPGRTVEGFHSRKSRPSEGCELLTTALRSQSRICSGFPCMEDEVSYFTPLLPENCTRRSSKLADTRLRPDCPRLSILCARHVRTIRDKDHGCRPQ